MPRRPRLGPERATISPVSKVFWVDPGAKRALESIKAPRLPGVCNLQSHEGRLFMSGKPERKAITHKSCYEKSSHAKRVTYFFSMQYQGTTDLLLKHK